jgi:putative membrane protein
MAGIFYLPRLFVHHAENSHLSSNADRLFSRMEFKLFWVIMNPAMVASWFLGLGLTLIPGLIDWGMLWPWIKLFAVVAMTCFHFWLLARQKEFQAGKNVLSGKTYRVLNEIPTILLIIIVISVVVRPF